MKLVGLLILIATLAAPSASLANDWRHRYRRDHYFFVYSYPSYGYGATDPRHHTHRGRHYRYHHRYYHHKPYTCGHCHG